RPLVLTEDPMPKSDRPLTVDIPRPGTDQPVWSRVGIIGIAGFLVGIAWPRVAGIRLGPSVPADLAARVEASASPSGAPRATPSGVASGAPVAAPSGSA